jgi:hypothetical protein
VRMFQPAAARRNRASTPVRFAGVAAVLAAVAVSLGLMSCSSNGSQQDPPNSPAPRASGTTSPAPPQSGDNPPATQAADMAMPKDACALVSVDQVATATGQDIKPSPGKDESSVFDVNCSYELANDEGTVDVSVGKAPGNGLADLPEEMRAVLKPVPGLGKEAIGGTTGDDEAVLVVLTQSWVLNIDGRFPGAKLEQLVPIAKAALAH